jgi:hypothetical protein
VVEAVEEEIMQELAVVLVEAVEMEPLLDLELLDKDFLAV